MSKVKLVIFEGPDKVGKSTLFKMYRRATQYGPLAIDRFTGSNLVYDRHYGRNTDISKYLDLESQVQELMDCYLVGLTCDPTILVERISREEVDRDREIALENFRSVLELFDYYYTNTTRFSKICLLDTGLLSKEECLDIILKFTEEAR